MLIVFDGPNCSGKTTLIEKINKRLIGKYKIFLTKEPTQDVFGKYLKENHSMFDSTTYLFLITANRAYHNNIILKNSDKLILCDRYIPSSLALQQTLDISLDFIWMINQKFVMPDLTFFISASEIELEKRLNLRNEKSYVEKNLSRKNEIELYRSAYCYMKDKLENVYWLENDNNNLNIDFIVRKIEEWVKKKDFYD